jgi:hypothetical protein
MSDTQVMQPPARMTKAEIRELAEWMVKGQVVHAGMIAPRDIPLVFIPFSFMNFGDQTDRETWKYYLPYAILGVHCTTGMAVNGNPVFMECRFVHFDDLTAAILTGQWMEKAMQGVPVADPPVADPTARHDPAF